MSSYNDESIFNSQKRLVQRKSEPSLILSHHQIETEQTRSIINKNLRRTSTNSISFPILNINPLLLDSSSSPPLNKSNYYQPIDERRTNQDTNCTRKENEKVRVSLNQPQPQMTNIKTFTSLTSGLPLCRVRLGNNSEGPTPAKNNKLLQRPNENQISTNNRGFSRFLFNLDFLSNSNKEDKNRFDVYNLTPEIREEMKRIYVY
jgi:hypothetical protein